MDTKKNRSGYFDIGGGENPEGEDVEGENTEEEDAYSASKILFNTLHSPVNPTRGDQNAKDKYRRSNLSHIRENARIALAR